MLGKKCSLAPLKEELRKQGVSSPYARRGVHVCSLPAGTCLSSGFNNGLFEHFFKTNTPLGLCTDVRGRHSSRCAENHS